MKCTFCNYPDTYISNSRPVNNSKEVRRNRVCKSCDKRFTTMERVDLKAIMVLSKEGKKVSFDKEMLVSSIESTTTKGKSSRTIIEETVQNVVQTIRNRGERIVTSQEISVMVIDMLLELDKTSCVIYASSHLDLKGLSELIQKVAS